MSYATRVLQAMQYDVIYDPATVSAITKLSEDNAGLVLSQLAKGGGSGVCSP